MIIPVTTFIKMMKNPVKFKKFLFSRLPSAFFSGLKIKEIDETRCIVSVPYKWFSKNPFRSTYFACLAMAAEMSTGVQVMMHVYKRIPPISMLVIRMEANYFKKAVGLTNFASEDGHLIKNAIDNAIQTGEAEKIVVKSTGTNEAGELVAEFLITWSFKVKK
jgi:Domain of unknown function (DUF4442)